jgi:hypothetical protein
MRETSNEGRKLSRPLAIIIGLGLVVGGLSLLPLFFKPVSVSAQNACVSNLRGIQLRKSEWAQAHPGTPDRIVKMVDLFGDDWEGRMPSCPAGGRYTIGSLSELPTCSIGAPVHVLPKDETEASFFK